jgi:hypothetical protein
MTGHELVDRVRAPVLHGETAAPTDAQIAREIADLRGRIIRMLTTLFGDEAYAHAFTGGAESLATWWVNQPRPSIDEVTPILMRIAEAATSFDAQPKPELLRTQSRH